MMKKGEMLCRMIQLAVEKHAGQFDAGGSPYILHVLAVMHKLRTDDEELQCIAVGHDLIEDTDVTAHTLWDIGMTDRIVSAILYLTKVKGETDDEYLTRVLRSQDSIRVKMCDLRHNSDIRRLKGVRPKDITRMIKYHDMYLKLKENLR